MTSKEKFELKRFNKYFVTFTVVMIVTVLLARTDHIGEIFIRSNFSGILTILLMPGLVVCGIIALLLIPILGIDKDDNASQINLMLITISYYAIFSITLLLLLYGQYGTQNKYYEFAKRLLENYNSSQEVYIPVNARMSVSVKDRKVSYIEQNYNKKTGHIEKEHKFMDQLELFKYGIITLYKTNPEWVFEEPKVKKIIQDIADSSPNYDNVKALAEAIDFVKARKEEQAESAKNQQQTNRVQQEYQAIISKERNSEQ